MQSNTVEQSYSNLVILLILLIVILYLASGAPSAVEHLRTRLEQAIVRTSSNPTR